MKAADRRPVLLEVLKAKDVQHTNGGAARAGRLGLVDGLVDLVDNVDEVAAVETLDEGVAHILRLLRAERRDDHLAARQCGAVEKTLDQLLVVDGEQLGGGAHNAHVGNLAGVHVLDGGGVEVDVAKLHDGGHNAEDVHLLALLEAQDLHCCCQLRAAAHRRRQPSWRRECAATPPPRSRHPPRSCRRPSGTRSHRPWSGTAPSSRRCWRQQAGDRRCGSCARWAPATRQLRRRRHHHRAHLADDAGLLQQILLNQGTLNDAILVEVHINILAEARRVVVADRLGVTKGCKGTCYAGSDMARAACLRGWGWPPESAARSTSAGRSRPQGTGE